MADLELTKATRVYAPEAVAAALERISAQGLWLLLSLDRYGWRAEYDVIRVLLDARPGGEEGHFEEHSVLMSIGHLFALTDKLWRLVYGVRANRAGREFLNVEDGYLTAGYKFHRKHVPRQKPRALLCLGNRACGRHARPPGPGSQARSSRACSTPPADRAD